MNNDNQEVLKQIGELDMAIGRLEAELDNLKRRRKELRLSAGVDVPLCELGLSVRAYNRIMRAGIYTINEVLEILRRDPNEMLRLRNFGMVSLNELTSKLADKGYLV